MPLKLVEERIQQARERGEFDNLRGRGKPLDHSDYFNQPEALRVAHHLLRNASFVPEQVELRREIGELEARRKVSTNLAECETLMRQIGRLRIKLDLLG